MEHLKKQTGTLSFVVEDVFNEIMRRVVERLRSDNPSLPLLKDERSYKILSEFFLRGSECDLEDFEPTLCFDSEENDRKIDEWLALKKVYYTLKGRPGNRPLEKILKDDEVWIDLFKDHVSPQDIAMVIDLIQSVRLLGKGRTEIEIARLLGHDDWVIKVGNEYHHNEQNTSVNVGEAVEDERKATEQASNKKNIDGRQSKKKPGRPPKDSIQSLQKLFGVENDELWEKLRLKVQEFQDKYGKGNKKDESLIVYALLEARNGMELSDSDCNKLELYNAYKKENFFEISDSTFRGALSKKDSFKNYKRVVGEFEKILNE